MTCPACIDKPEIFLATSCVRLKNFPTQLPPVYDHDFLGIYNMKRIFMHTFSLWLIGYRCLITSPLEM